MNTDHWLERIDRITNSFTEQFDTLDEESLNRRPDENTWSIAQNIIHIIKLNESYYPLVNDIRNGNYKLPFTGRFGFLADAFGRFIHNAVQPGNPGKMKTFSIWEPPSGFVPGNILKQFENHQEELKKFIRDNTDLISQRTIISSPAKRIVVYRFNTAIEIIVSHEERHLEQSRRVLKDIINTSLSKLT